ncbi:MAG: TIGR03621 family F420-dependent LLM class oxidoreductase [Thermomicrobiales bacterium]
MAHRFPFRFGVINERPLPRDEWLALVRRVEELGYATFLIRDHLATDFFGPQYGPIAALATAAAITSRLRVGTMVIANDFRHPAILAKEFATLSVLSGGRVELGIGAGWMRAEYDQTGITFDSAGQRIARLEESLAIIDAIWRGERLSFAGAHYRIEDLAGYPLVGAGCRPTLVVGGGRPRALRLAGRVADVVGVLTSAYGTGRMISPVSERTQETVKLKISWIQEGAGDRFEQVELSMIPTIVVTDDREAAASAAVLQYGWEGHAVADVLEMPSMLLGTIEEIIDGLVRRREEFGFSYIVVSDTQMEEFAPVVAALRGR